MAVFKPEKDVIVSDPVCGMRLALNKAAAQEEYGGWAYFFCSRACHELFRKAPKRYAAAAGRPNPFDSSDADP